MANVVIVGGGFGGVVAAESLAKRLGSEHQITLVSRSRQFLFYPGLVRLAFGKCGPDDISFDARNSMIDRRIRFVDGEVARLNPIERHITLARGDMVGKMPYDYLVLALGRRLKTELVTGFYEYAHHLLTVSDAIKFGEAARLFNHGDAVIGYCSGARLPVPVFETAFTLSRFLEEQGSRDDCTITVVSNETPDEMFGGTPMSEVLQGALANDRIQLVSDFAITEVTPTSVIAADGRKLNSDLNMVIPPAGGPGALIGTGLTDEEGYLRVETTMRVQGTERIYAAGDCVSLNGPKLGHMAVRQGEVVAENLAAEIEGKAPSAIYDHELMLVIDTGGDESIFLHKDLWSEEDANIRHGRFWKWAKRLQERYWEAKHS